MIPVVGSLVMSSFAVSLFLVTVSLGRDRSERFGVAGPLRGPRLTAPNRRRTRGGGPSVPSTDNATPATPAAAPGGRPASAPRRPASVPGLPDERPRAGCRYEDFTLGDLTAIRNLLRGGSVIDWHRLYFTDRDEVDRFLRVNEFDPADEDDMRRLGELRDGAVEYLERHLGFHIPDEVAHGVPPRDLLLIASQKGRRRTHACIVLKVMHVMHHLAGRELLTKLPVSDDQIFHLVEEKVLRTVEEIRAAGCPVVEFEWSRKHADSLITKLLAKKEIHRRRRLRQAALPHDHATPRSS